MSLRRSAPVRADIAIVGGGVIGCSIARELARRGMDVVVIERAHPGAEASSAAAGLLAPQSEAHEPGPFCDLGLESRALYPDWIAELSAETGLELGYRRCGILRCSYSGDRLLRQFGWQAKAGLSVEVPSPDALASLTGGRLTSEVREALFFADEAIVDSARLTEAVARSAVRRGARLLTETRALRIVVESGSCRGVETDRGRVDADRVIDAAGAWAGFDATLGCDIPVEPVRGQMVELRREGVELPTVVQSDDVYLVPRAGGSVLAGATVERVGFLKEVTAGGVAALIAAATALVPDLAEAAFVRAWCGLRPATPDGWPILGPTPVDGLYLAAGHFRNGILLAPVTASLLADAVTGAGHRDLTAFAVDRFSARASRRPCPPTPPQVFG